MLYGAVTGLPERYSFISNTPEDSRHPLINWEKDIQTDCRRTREAEDRAPKTQRKESERRGVTIYGCVALRQMPSKSAKSLEPRNS